METNTFNDVPAWPDANERALNRHDNQPPLEERILLDFQEDLDRVNGEQSISGRVRQLLESTARVPEINSTAIAGKVGDLLKQAADARKRIESVRESHNRPLLNAQRSLKAKADGADEDLVKACADLRGRLNAFMAAEAAKQREAQRIADEEARKAREAAEASALESAAKSPAYDPLAFMPRVAPAVVEKPVARGDLGARVGTVKQWKHEILSVRQLPDRLLKHPKVLEALSQVIGAEIRGMGTTKGEIKGVRIWSEDVAAIR